MGLHSSLISEQRVVFPFVGPSQNARRKDRQNFYHDQARWRSTRPNCRHYQEVRAERLQDGCHEIHEAYSGPFEEHYGDLKEKPFFPGLIKYVGEGPVVAMVWEGLDAVKTGRAMLGETDPLKSKPGSIRGDYSIQVGRNIIHGSDSNESAAKEIGLWFDEKELVDWQPIIQSMVYE